MKEGYFRPDNQTPKRIGLESCRLQSERLVEDKSEQRRIPNIASNQSVLA